MKGSQHIYRVKKKRPGSLVIDRPSPWKLCTLAKPTYLVAIVYNILIRQVSKSPVVLPQIYAAAKPKQFGMVPPVIKETMWLRFRAF